MKTTLSILFVGAVGSLLIANPIPFVIGAVFAALVRRQERVVEEAQEQYGYNPGFVYRAMSFAVPFLLFATGLLALAGYLMEAQ